MRKQGLENSQDAGKRREEESELFNNFQQMDRGISTKKKKYYWKKKKSDRKLCETMIIHGS